MNFRIIHFFLAPFILFSFFAFSSSDYSPTVDAFVPQSSSTTPDEKTFLTGITLIDGKGGQPKSNQMLVVSGGRIVDIFPTGSKKIPADANVVDLTGKFVIPGLIDTHVHLGTQERPAEMTNAILRNALLGGVTTARDMGGNGAKVSALAEQQKNGTIQSPRVYYSTLIIGSDSTFWMTDEKGKFVSNGMPPGKTVWFQQVAPDADIVKVIAESKAFGATGIKIHSGIAPDLLERLTREAHRQGLKVWSHSTITPSRAIDAVEANVDVLSHADGISVERAATEISAVKKAQNFAATQETNDGAKTSEAIKMPVESEDVTKLLKRVKKKGSFIEPTLFIMALFETNAKDANKKRQFKSSYDYACGLTRRAKEFGIPLTTGSDNIGGGSPNLHSELQLLVKCGLSPLETITAATFNGARTLGIEKDYGTLEIGKIADLVILSRNPIADIRNTQTVEYVMQGGKLYKRNAPVQTPPLAEPPPLYRNAKK